MTEYEFIETEQHDAALVAKLSNPPNHLLNAKMVGELGALVSEVASDDAVRTLVLTGAADGVFITHYDVGELSGASDAMRTQEAPAGGPAELHGMHQLLLAIQRLPKPVIAAINGTAMGGGFELALACDFRFASRGGVLGLPEVRVGILPGAGGTQRMTRLIGTAKALELMLLGNVLDADSAERVGLIHKAVDAGTLLLEALTLANELASRPRLSLAHIKRCVLEGSELPLVDGLKLEQELFYETMRSDDAARLMRAYVQGQTPLNES